MLLHLPARDMSQANFLDTRSCRSILADMVTALAPRSRSVSFGAGLVAKGRVQVFEHDIYTVVLASDAIAIPSALPQVPAPKRPEINAALCAFYARCYPGWPLALCCFDNRQAQQAAPLLLWYAPLNPNYFLLPALDCHTGEVPRLDEPVEVDHQVMLGSDDFPPGVGSIVDYHDTIPGEVDAFLPQRVIGRHFSGRMTNGDFGISAQAMQHGSLTQLARLGPATVRETFTDKLPISKADLEAVVQQHYGEDHFIVDLAEHDHHYLHLFPAGTRCWEVEHESHTCTHRSRCHWFCSIYWYQNRFTLITVEEMHRLSLRDLIDRVSGAIQN